MAKPVPIHLALLDQTIAMLAKMGLENLSLRTIAARADCTTAVIFQQYKGKAGLLSAAIDRALEQDTQAHAALLGQISGLIGSREALADFIASYVSIRACQDVPRFWSEILFKSQQLPEARLQLQQWFAMRTRFWQDVLETVTAEAALGDMIAAYSIMEEIYAYPLLGDAQYRLLLHETARALIETAFGPAHVHARSLGISEKLDKTPWPANPELTDNADMREQLLTHAIRAIVENGIGTINQRSLSQKAGVSSSMIAYHFKDMKSFVNEAIWRALVQGIPPVLDPGRAAMPTTMQQWFEALETYVRPRIGETAAGFYTVFARITGQACLLADSRPSLMALVHHLRALEGWGTHRVVLSIHPQNTIIAREHAAAFGMWIKAEAVLREAGLRPPIASGSAIADVARRIFPQR
ncbi:MAG: TetR/AcrR family transcriptional regulator [Blastomonas fulva]|jgi:AcrR family transcriptional regulator|uniref:TetR/AcrR family transcriptional regulator n=1 Tax=Blastomonas fulva TaxID=1550728 RepID=UPI004033DE64